MIYIHFKPLGRQNPEAGSKEFQTMRWTGVGLLGNGRAALLTVRELLF
jgi:hypothetical protein